MTEVSPFVNEGTDGVHYRSCDLCYETAVNDIWAGKRQESEWRKFYLMPRHYCLCGNCFARENKDAL